MCPTKTLPRDGIITVPCLAVKALKHRAVTYRLATQAISQRRRTVAGVLEQGKTKRPTKMSSPITITALPQKKEQLQGTRALADPRFGLKSQRQIYQHQIPLLHKILIRTLGLACLVFLRPIKRAANGASCLSRTVQHYLSRRDVMRARKKINLRGNHHPTQIPARNLK